MLWLFFNFKEKRVSQNSQSSVSIVFFTGRALTQGMIMWLWVLWHPLFFKIKDTSIGLFDSSTSESVQQLLSYASNRTRPQIEPALELQKKSFRPNPRVALVKIRSVFYSSFQFEIPEAMEWKLHAAVWHPLALTCKWGHRYPHAKMRENSKIPTDLLFTHKKACE